MEMELEHISHSHPITLWDEKNHDGVVPRCDGCLLPLSGASYSCKECEFFLHESCAELPNKIIHYLHPKHPLTFFVKPPYPLSSIVSCACCHDTIWGFDYHCSLCKYDICIRCVSLEQIVEHEGHEHSFKLLRPTSFTCDACGKIGSDTSYICSTCHLWVHPSCGWLPPTIKHIGHDHPLSLIHSIPLDDPMDDSLCKVCGEDVDTCYWCYYCASCRYLAHLGCATSASASVPNECTIDLISNDLNVISHPHPMTLWDETNHDGAIPPCDGCLLPLSGAAYNCKQCKFFLHKVCAELPNKIIYFLHPKHPLTLFPKTPYISISGMYTICNNCRERVWGFDYHCSFCKFDLCIQCVLLQQIVESEGHKHSFKLLRQASFTCDACGEIGNDISCICTTCLLWVHKSCASLPPTIKHVGHDHPLSLIQSIQLNDPMDDCFLCKVCNKDVNKCYWCYYCASCRYIAHLGCATSVSASVPNEECTIIDLISNDLNEIISLTKSDNDQVNEVSHTKIERVTELQHFTHQHSLTLSDDDPEREEICDGCVQTISAPFYKCAQCNVFLHVSCAELPDEIQHPLHPHSLALLANQKPYICDACYHFCNGLAYGCMICKFFIDLKCTSVSGTLRHEAHEHTLSLNQKISKSKCNACGVTCSTKFRCEACDFNLHLGCAALPSSVKHKWDKHPLKLTFSMNEDKRLGKYYCDFCEERRTDPNHWFYYCEDCDIAVHPECLLGKHTMIKFGKSYKLDIHHHLLTSVKKTKRCRSGHCSDHDKNSLFLLKCHDCDFHCHS